MRPYEVLSKRKIPRIARWWIELQEYSFIIQYRAQAKMNHVDCLSRDPAPDIAFVNNIVNITESEWVQAVQSTDDDIQFIIRILSSLRTKQNQNYFENFILKAFYIEKYRHQTKSRLWGAFFLHPIPKVSVPFSDVHLDHLGPFIQSKKKNAYLLVLMDCFTKLYVFVWQSFTYHYR